MVEGVSSSLQPSTKALISLMRTEPLSANQFPQTPLSLNIISQAVLVLAIQD